MEEQVTKILETNLATTEGLIELESQTAEGVADLDLHFNYGTDVNFALQDASKNLDRARARLPIDAEPPTIRKFDPSQIPVFEVGFSSPTRGLVDLRNWSGPAAAAAAAVDRGRGLGRCRRRPDPRDPRHPDQERLRSYGLTIADVLTRIRAENQDVAVGNVTSPSFEIVGKTTGKFTSVDDIRRVLLTVPGTAARIP